MFRTSLLIVFVFLGACKGKSQQTDSDPGQGGQEMAEFPVSKTEAEWRAELTDMEYYILRRAGTENAGSSELLDNKEKGTYVCAGCQTPVFLSRYKFDSGTGWPSFDRAVEGNVAYSTDNKIGYTRTEEHCANCGGHLGHVFDDGPRETTGKRHCINGAALDFIPDTGGSN